MRLRIALGVGLGVVAAWLGVAVVWGAQTALGSVVTGRASVALGPAIKGTLQQVVPWIPLSLAVIALGARFPLTRDRWKRHAPIHLLAAPLLSFGANVLVVLMYWAGVGRFQGFATLAQQGTIWAIANFHITLVIYAVLLGATQAVLYYRESRERELKLARLEGQLAEARLQALQAQVRPHFLFNTLHTIGQLWRSGRSDDAEAVLDRLGALSHRVLSSTAQVEVPLAEELDLVRDYLAIEAVRFRDRLRPVVTAPDDTQRCLVPSLILQPLVENAIRHGVSALGTAGRVEVVAVRNGGTLTLTVRDDGPGFGAASPSPGAGTGLRNARARLAELYGAAAELTTADEAGGGAVVTVTIPLRTNERAQPTSGGGHG